MRKPRWKAPRMKHDDPIVKIVWLNAVELALVRDYGTRRNLTGGFETLAKVIYAHTNNLTGKCELTEPMILRIRHYTNPDYRQGGYQDTCLRPAFRRHLNL
jgi:hypothetical protein